MRPENLLNTHPEINDTMLPHVNPPPRAEWEDNVSAWEPSADDGFRDTLCAEAAHDTVTIDSSVEIRDLRTNEIEEYTLVAPNDANILENRISSLTPLGRALFGRRVGDVVEYDAPAGTIRIRIERLRCPCGAQATAHDSSDH